MVKSFTATVVTLKKEGLFIATKDFELINRLELEIEIMISFLHNDGQKYVLGTYKVVNVLHESPVLIMVKPWKVNFSLLRRHFRFNLEMPLYYLVNGDVHVGQIIDLSSCGASAIVSASSQIY